jgi:hypothetical protein
MNTSAEKLKYETPALVRRERLNTIVASTTSGPPT